MQGLGSAPPDEVIPHILKKQGNGEHLTDQNDPSPVLAP